jgi:hypothetical protein
MRGTKIFLGCQSPLPFTYRQDDLPCGKTEGRGEDFKTQFHGQNPRGTYRPCPNPGNGVPFSALKEKNKFISDPLKLQRNLVETK